MIDHNHCQTEIFQLLREAKSASLTLEGEIVILDDISLLKIVKSLMACRAFRVDSRAMERGDVYMAVVGNHVCGSQFVPKVAEIANFLVFSEQDWHDRHLKQWFGDLLSDQKKNIVGKCVIVDSKKVDWLAKSLPAPFYRYPSQRLHVTGVTGTNGKTSLCYLLERAYEQQFSVGVIGTIEARFSLREKRWGIADKKKKKNTAGVRHFSLPNTTPNAAILQHLLAKMADAGVQMVFLEISSHALVLGRVTGLQLDSLLWTNFTAEHLDFHATIQDYFSAKCLAFDLLKDKKSAFVLMGVRGLKRFDFSKKLKKASFPVFALDGHFSDHKKEKKLHSEVFSGYFFYESLKNDDFYQNVQFSLSLDQDANTTANTNAEGKEWEKKCALSADFLGAGATENLSLLLLHRYFHRMAMQYGEPKVDSTLFHAHTLQKDLDQLKHLSIAGRMRRVKNYPIYIDYAHTPDALAMVLKMMRDKKRKLVVIFGCGGNRDRQKRGEMGKNAWDLADVVIVTSDNPRDEDPLKIIQDILGDMSLGRIKSQKQLVIIADRQQAIAYGVSLLKNDHDDECLILLAGKGHEKYQIIRSQRKIFDEKKIVHSSFSHFLSNRFFLSEMVQNFGDVSLLMAGKSWDSALLLSRQLHTVKKYWKQEIHRAMYSLFSDIFTDTRAEEKGDIFFAFDGENYSATDFVDDARTFGAKIFIVEDRHFSQMRAWSKKIQKASSFWSKMFLQRTDSSLNTK